MKNCIVTSDTWKQFSCCRKLRTEEDTMFARIQRSICLSGLLSNLSVCHLRRCPVGGYRCKRAHWRGALPTCPPASLTAVCCTMWSPRCSRQNNPHSYTHESVHLAPHARIKPPEPYRHGDTGKLLQSCCCGIYQIQQSEILLHAFYSVHRKARAEVVHIRESLGCDREVKWRGTEQDKPRQLTASRAE